MIQTFTSALALAVALVLIGAALDGARRPAGLSSAIDAYRLLPDRSGRYAAWLLVCTEAVSALLLIAPQTRLAGAVIAVFLVLIFLVAIAVSILRGSTDFDCGCGGFVALRPGVALLLRNVLLFLACLVVMSVPSQALSVWQCVLAVALASVWHILNALIAATQSPFDD